MRRPPLLLKLLLAGLLTTPAQTTLAQSFDDAMQDIRKCARKGEVFYTQGDCPHGARQVKFNDPLGDAAPTRATARESAPVRQPRERAPAEQSVSSVQQSSNFRPLSSFPPLPESESNHRAEEREQREMPIRAASSRVESTPVADPAAENQVLCSFVAAELSRLATELGGADAANQARIATHQKRLQERAEQLKC